MKKLHDKVALITGAGAGMGRAMAKLFASEGCKVIATDINKTDLDSLKIEIEKEGGVVTSLLADMAIPEDIESMFDVTLDQYGKLDILINNAGVMDNFSPVGETEDKMLQRVMHINVIGPFKAMRRAVNIMEKNETGGAIINISSIGGLFGARAGAAYTTSKHAIIGLSKNTAFMYAKKGIRTNVIAPGGVLTNISEGDTMKQLNIEAFKFLQPGMGLNPRMGKPEEVANVALFLASDDASFINGAIITTDGGWTSY